jgi:hypothetical protein
MSTQTPPAVGIFAAKAVAQAVGLDVAALVMLGVPVAADLTRDDLASLSAELKRKGYPARAYSLEVFMRQHNETPSRALFAPKAATAPVDPAWLKRKDLCG